MEAVNKVPAIFVCENNFYSTHMPIRDCRPNDDIYRIAQPFDIPSAQIDGNDVLRVYETAKKAVDNARSGKGPYFIECLTYRLRGHVGPDDNIQGSHTDIRPAEEVASWREKDPIPRFEKYMLENRILDENGLESIQNEVEKEIQQAFETNKECSFPMEEELMDHVFK